MTMQAARVRANGIMHHVRVWDGPPERTVLVLHGYLDHGESFEPLAERIAHEGHRVWAPDFRGHGRSGWVPEGGYYYFPDYIADMTLLLDAMGMPREGSFAMVAHSMGGSVATMIAGALPERVTAVALLEGTGPPGHPPEATRVRTQRWLEALRRPQARERKRMSSLSEAVMRLRSTHGGTVSDEILTRAAAAMTQPHPSGEGLTWRFDPMHQTPSPTRFDQDAFEQFARAITAPVLMVDGGDNGMFPEDRAVRRGWYARHTEVTLAGAGHMMHWTQPDALANAVVPFLRETLAGRPRA